MNEKTQLTLLKRVASAVSKLPVRKALEYKGYKIYFPSSGSSNKMRSIKARPLSGQGYSPEIVAPDGPFNKQELITKIKAEIDNLSSETREAQKSFPVRKAQTDQTAFEKLVAYFVSKGIPEAEAKDWLSRSDGTDEDLKCIVGDMLGHFDLYPDKYKYSDGELDTEATQDYVEQLWSKIINQRLAQKSFPAKYLGHIIEVHKDGGGGHKAVISKGNKVKHVTKRHADPMNALHSAKMWINDQRDISSVPFSKGDSSSRSAQALLPDPTNTEIVAAPDDVNDLRDQAVALQNKILDVQQKAQSYVDALANKVAAGSKIQTSGGLLGLQQEALRLHTELNDKLKQLPANFIQFANGVTVAKVQTARINDASWKDLIDAARTRGRGVMQRVTQILDRLSILFKKLTADIQLQEFAPGELDQKGMQKIVDKNVKNTQKIKQFNQSVSDAAPRAQRYFLDEAEGGIVQTPRKSSKEYRINSPQTFSEAFSSASQILRKSPHKNALSELQQLKSSAKEGDYWKEGNNDWVDIEDDLNALMRRFSQRTITAQDYQTEFDFCQEMVEALDDSLRDITYINSDLQNTLNDLTKVVQQQSAYPLPDANEDENEAMPIAASKFSKAANPSGIQKVRRSAVLKTIATKLVGEKK